METEAECQGLVADLQPGISGEMWAVCLGYGPQAQHTNCEKPWKVQENQQNHQYVNEGFVPGLRKEPLHTSSENCENHEKPMRVLGYPWKWRPSAGAFGRSSSTRTPKKLWKPSEQIENLDISW